jgi:hypothetical protein
MISYYSANRIGENVDEINMILDALLDMDYDVPYSKLSEVIDNAYINGIVFSGTEKEIISEVREYFGKPCDNWDDVAELVNIAVKPDTRLLGELAIGLVVMESF